MYKLWIAEPDVLPDRQDYERDQVYRIQRCRLDKDLDNPRVRTESAFCCYSKLSRRALDHIDTVYDQERR